jgi:hypothetical protein
MNLSVLPVVPPPLTILLLHHQTNTIAEKQNILRNEKPNRQKQQSPANEKYPNRLWGFYDSSFLSDDNVFNK